VNWKCFRFIEHTLICWTVLLTLPSLPPSIHTWTEIYRFFCVCCVFMRLHTHLIFPPTTFYLNIHKQEKNSYGKDKKENGFCCKSHKHTFRIFDEGKKSHRIMYYDMLTRYESIKSGKIHFNLWMLLKEKMFKNNFSNNSPRNAKFIRMHTIIFRSMTLFFLTND
jgi:hypothetical protein